MINIKNKFAPLTFLCLLLVVISLVLLIGSILVNMRSPKSSSNSYYVTKTGNDNNPGTSSQPWLTIQKAARTVVAGDTVNIQAGTYNEKVTPSNSGNASSPITYQTYGTGTVILDGTGKSTSNTGVFDIENKNYITLKGIQIQNSQFAGVFVYGASDHITLQNLTIHDTGIHFIFTISIENGAFTGVKQRTIFQYADYSFNCIQAAATVSQNNVANQQCL